MRRTIVVGDVHGCREELERLLVSAGHEPSWRVVLVGDLVAKGPDSAGVVALARRIGAVAVLGNHDVRVLEVGRTATGDTPGDPADASGDPGDHAVVARNLGDEDFAWLGALPYYLRLEEHGAVVVHAGLVPGVPLEDQDPVNLVSMRTLRDDGTASKRLSGGAPWATRWHGPELVLFGHDAVTGLQLHDHAIGLDTGCVYGGALSACILPDRRIVSVPAIRAWASP